MFSMIKQSFRLLVVALIVTVPLLAHSQQLININIASAEELDTLPGIGPTKAQAIIDYRTQNGSFQTLSQIMDVPGIGQGTFSNIQDLITVGEGLDENVEIEQGSNHTVDQTEPPDPVVFDQIIDLTDDEGSSVGEPIADTETPADDPVTETETTPTQETAPAGALVNVNTATLEELDTLPGIGPAKAQAIVDHREQNGPFQTVDDLLNVSGIGPGTMSNIRSLVTVE